MRGPLAATVIAMALGAAPAGAEPAFGWQYLYDGGSQQADTGVKILVDAADNPVIAAHVTDVAGNGNLLIRKLAREGGGEIWTRSIPGTGENPKVIGDMTWDGAGHLLIGGTRLGCYG